MRTATAKNPLLASNAADTFGFREGPRSVHTSRTLMLAELNGLLDACGASAPRDDYRRAVLEENVLGKRTMTARRNTFTMLRELYALDREVPVFRLMRSYWDLDPTARPLLALLCAAARDPFVRLSAGPVLALSPGEVLALNTLAQAIEESSPGRFSTAVRNALASRLASSWAQAGHLTGVRPRRRSWPVATPANLAYALALGYLQRAGGRRLFTTLWAKLLDRTETELQRLAAEASRRSWLNYRQQGTVIEVRFPGRFTPAEEELLRGEDRRAAR